LKWQRIYKNNVEANPQAKNPSLLAGKQQGRVIYYPPLLLLVAVQLLVA